jgi:hypothetical protein
MHAFFALTIGYIAHTEDSERRLPMLDLLQGSVCEASQHIQYHNTFNVQIDGTSSENDVYGVSFERFGTDNHVSRGLNA